jgi:hypothetical protein
MLERRHDRHRSHRRRCLPHQPVPPRPQHEQLLALCGRWSGTTSTWLDPAAPADQAGTEATIEALLGGRFVRIDYQSAVQGRPHAGQMIFGFHSDARAFELAWLDSFHTGTAMMLSTGAASVASVTGGDSHGVLASVLGSPSAGTERWGWRTVLRPLPPTSSSSRPTTSRRAATRIAPSPPASSASAAAPFSSRSAGAAGW